MKKNLFFEFIVSLVLVVFLTNISSASDKESENKKSLEETNITKVAFEYYKEKMEDDIPSTDQVGELSKIRMGYGIVDFADIGEEIWEARILTSDKLLKAILWINPDTKKVFDVTGPWSPDASQTGVYRVHSRKGYNKNIPVGVVNAISEIIHLLEKKKYAAMLDRYISPEQREEGLDGKTIREMAKAFADERAEFLLKCLKGIRNKEPEISDDGDRIRAKFENDEDPKLPVVFVEIDGKWYLEN